MKQTVTLLATLILIAVTTIPAHAEEPVWCMVTDQGHAIEMSQVACLAAADEETTFGIVLKDGTIINNVQRVTFDQIIPTGIRRTSETPLPVNRELGLEGIAPETPVNVYDTGGKLRMKGTAGLITFTTLPDGIYIIQINNTSFKIRKQHE